MNQKRVYSAAEVDEVIDAWHDGIINTDTLHEALGWTWAEYAVWLTEGKLPVGPMPDL